jgi:general secretion pathway protein K
MTPSSRRGSVLILALWTLSLLAVFCVSVGFSARQKAAMMSRIQDSDRYFTIAYSGVQKMAGVLIPDENNLWETTQGLWYNNPHDFKNAEVGDGFFSFDTPVYDENTHKMKGVAGAVDEESKINVNTADAAVIVKLLEDGLDIGSDTAQTIGYAIVDWRDSDSFYNHPNYGAEDQDYKDLSKPYEAKDAPFEVLDELLLVKGINREIFDRIKPFVTVYGDGEVNINTASRPVLTALGLSQVLIDKIMQYFEQSFYVIDM